jgi:hypothetical protein
VQGVADTKKPLNDLTKVMKPDLIIEWQEAEEKALNKRGDYLRVYNVNIAAGQFIVSFLE